MRTGPLSRAIATGMLLAATGVAAWAGPATEKAIRELEQTQARAAIARDREALEKIFAPDFIVINPSGGVADRAELLRLLTTGTAAYRSADYETQQFRDLGDTVVTVGLEKVVPNQGPQAGQTVQRRTTQVWHREGGAWRLRLRQANIVQ